MHSRFRGPDPRRLVCILVRPDGETDSVPGEDWAGTYGIKQNSNMGTRPYLTKYDMQYELFRMPEKENSVHMLEKEVSINVDMPI